MLKLINLEFTQIIKQIIIGLKEVSILGILPIIPTSFTLLGSFMIWVMKISKTTPLQEMGVDEPKKNYKTGKIYYKIDSAYEVLLAISILLSIIPFIAVFNEHFTYYISGMLSKIEVLNSYVIGLTTMVITMSVVIIILDKKYYLVFTIKEVLQEYNFFKSLIIVIISCLSSTISTMTLLDQKVSTYFDELRFMILELSVIFNILSVCYCFYVIVKIMFSEKNSEFVLLEKLYRVFWFYKIERINIKDKKDWQKDIVNTNIEYLSLKYAQQCKKIKIFKVKEIEFVTTVGNYKQKWYKKARIKFIKVTGLCFAISTIINLAILREQCIGLSVVNFIIMMIGGLFVIVKPLSLQLAVLRMYSDTWGYYIRYKKEKFVPRVPMWTKSKFNRMFIVMNSLNAFMYLLIDVVGEKDIVEEAFATLDKSISTLQEKNMFTYFPIFTIGFFAFYKGLKIERIKEIYSMVTINEDMERIFDRMLNSQLFYLTSKLWSEAYGYSKKLNEYMEWIKSDRELSVALNNIPTSNVTTI